MRSVTRIYSRILAPNRRRVIVVMSFSLFAGLLEATGIASLVTSLGDNGATRGTVYRGLILLGALLVASVASRCLSETQALALNVEIETRLRSAFLDHLLKARWAAIRETSSGDLVTALLSESSQVANGATASVSAVSALVIASVLAVAALFVAPLLVVTSAGFGAISIVAYRRAGRLSRTNQARLAESASVVNDEAVALLSNAKLLLSSGDRLAWRERFQRMLRHYVSLRKRDLHLPIVVRSVVESFGAVFLAGTMAVAVSMGQPMSRALLTMALFYRVIPRLQVAQTSYLVARTQMVWLERWHDRSVRWKELSDSQGGAPHDRPVFTDPFSSLELRGVSVLYPGRNSPALTSVDLRFGPGLVVAIIGTTGSGKTTLLDLLTGLTDPTDGEVLLNGRDLRSWDMDSWQQRVGYVPQESAMVSGSMIDNIAWLDRSEELSMVKEAAEIACLGEFVATLPAGLHTEIGPRASALSGGQKQRIALARAIYRNPDLLILDEATSALDERTERTALENIRSRFRTSAVVLVTHRLTTLDLVDVVVEVRDGRVEVKSGLDAPSADLRSFVRQSDEGFT